MPATESLSLSHAGAGARGLATEENGWETWRAKSWRDWFEQIWLFVLPITSILVVPKIQGTTPATLCAAFSLLVVLCSPAWQRNGYLWRMLKVLTVFGVCQALSVLAITQFNVRHMDLLKLTTGYHPHAAIQPVVITQSMYLMVTIITCVYTVTYSDRRWYSWMYAGAVFLLLYGIYEWCFYLVTQQSGDFLSNRTFFDISDTDDEGFSGSLVQSLDLLGMSFLRLKSLTGEPSMFTLAILPYFFFAMHTGRKVLAWALLIGLMLSTSTTAFVSLAFGVGLSVLWQWREGYRMSRGTLLALLVFAGLIALFMATDAGERVFMYFVDEVQEKFRGEGTSGSERSESHSNSVKFFLRSPLVIQFFGLGFGVTRPFSFFDWLVINGGVLGTLVWLGFFLYPVYRLPNVAGVDRGLKVAIFTVVFAMCLGVPEYAYPTSWLFLGLAYARINQLKLAARMREQMVVE